MEELRDDQQEQDPVEPGARSGLHRRSVDALETPSTGRRSRGSLRWRVGHRRRCRWPPAPSRCPGDASGREGNLMRDRAGGGSAIPTLSARIDCGSRSAGRSPGARPNRPKYRHRKLGASCRSRDVLATISSHSPIAGHTRALGGSGISSIRQANSQTSASASGSPPGWKPRSPRRRTDGIFSEYSGLAPAFRSVPGEGFVPPMERILSMESVRFEGPALTRRAGDRSQLPSLSDGTARQYHLGRAATGLPRGR